MSNDIIAVVQVMATEAGLSPAQRPVFDYLLQGLTNDEIASRMRIKAPTVACHVTAILRKLRVKKRARIPALVLERLGNPCRGEGAPPAAPCITRDLLELAGMAVDLRSIESWTQEQRDQAAAWAGSVYLGPGDKTIPVLPRPSFLPRDRQPPVTTGEL